MEINRITTILDKPKHDQVAWRRSLDLQERSGASLEVISFLWNAMCEGSSSLDPADRKKLRHGLIEERKAWMAELVAKAPEKHGKIKAREIWGHDIAAWAEDDLVEKKADKRPDLVIKTVHKSGSMVHTPTDWAMLRSCPVPVLLTAKRRGKTSGKVVASLDLRHTDAKHRHLNCRVLEAAHRFAELYDAKVHVVFAVEISQVLRDLDIISERAAKKKIVERVTPELERLLQPYHIPKSRVHMPVGKVGRVVAQVSRKLNSDLLVIGSYAHRVKQTIGLGNSAERIISKAVGDVLVMHP